MSEQEKKEIDKEDFETETKKDEKAADTKAADTKTKDAKVEENDVEKSNEEYDVDVQNDEVKEDEESSSDSELKNETKKKDKKQELIDELNDRVKRQMAEFENFRKRTEKEKTQMYGMGAKSTLEKILPVVDNFERGLAAAEEGDSFAEGMKMIYKQLMNSLADAGVKEIEAEGKEFDPNIHNAVMHIDDEEFGENIVVEVLQKGYMYNDEVLRHSMVKVAN